LCRRGIRDQLFKDHSLSLNDMAEREGIVPSYATRLFRLAFLSPDIIAVILDGRQPPELTVRRLLDGTRLPLEWSEQRAKLGFAYAPLAGEDGLRLMMENLQSAEAAWKQHVAN
jgi:hypothetical protein